MTQREINRRLARLVRLIDQAYQQGMDLIQDGAETGISEDLAWGLRGAIHYLEAARILHSEVPGAVLQLVDNATR